MSHSGVTLGEREIEMSMIKELIKLNRRAAAGPAPGTVSRVPRRRHWRQWIDLLAVEQALDETEVKTVERKLRFREETARIKEKMRWARYLRRKRQASGESGGGRSLGDTIFD